MKKSILLFVSPFVFSFLIVSQTAFGFEWLERGFTVKSQESTAEGSRIFLEDPTQRSFVIIAELTLLTDPVKEKILSTFAQVMETYNLPTSLIEFKIKPGIFTITLQLKDTEQFLGLTHHGLNPPDSLIPTASAILNEFSTWQGFTGKRIQLVFKGTEFQAVVVPETEVPLIDIQIKQGQPPKKLISDLAIHYNQVASWKGLDPETIGFSLTDKGFKLTIDPQNKEKSLGINYLGGLPEKKSINRVSKFYALIKGWKNIKTNQIQLVAQKNQVDAIISPTRFSNKGKNLLPHLPAGMAFRYDNKFSYNFRVVSKDYFVRLKNNYTTEQKLIWQINEAIKDPILYIQKYDPDYFYRQIEGLRNRHAEVYDELKTTQQTSYDALLEKHQKLLASYDTLKKAHETFIYGVITMENAGLLSTKPVNREAIARIIELKTANPDLTDKEIDKQLEAEKIKTSSKVINLVFSLYFNEFN